MTIPCPRCGQPYPDERLAGGRTLTCRCGETVRGPLLDRPAARTPPLAFFADVMLGRLAVYLRLLGFDTKHEDAIDDDALVATAIAEDRILLTRDRGLLARWHVSDFVGIEADRPREQLAELSARYPLREGARPFTRCSACNVPVIAGLYESPASPERTPSLLSSRCPSCGRLYWEGSHVARLQAMFRDTLGGWRPP